MSDITTNNTTRSIPECPFGKDDHGRERTGEYYRLDSDSLEVCVFYDLSEMSGNFIAGMIACFCVLLALTVISLLGIIPWEITLSLWGVFGIAVSQVLVFLFDKEIRKEFLQLDKEGFFYACRTPTVKSETTLCLDEINRFSWSFDRGDDIDEYYLSISNRFKGQNTVFLMAHSPLKEKLERIVTDANVILDRRSSLK